MAEATEVIVSHWSFGSIPTRSSLHPCGTNAPNLIMGRTVIPVGPNADEGDAGGASLARWVGSVGQDVAFSLIS